MGTHPRAAGGPGDPAESPELFREYAAPFRRGGEGAGLHPAGCGGAGLLQSGCKGLWAKPAAPRHALRGSEAACVHGLGARTAYRGGQPVPDAECTLSQTAGPDTDVIAFDSLIVALFEVDCRQGSTSVAWDSISARLAVTAFDTAYARYAKEVLDSRSREAIRAPRASAGIQGVLGLFGGAAAATRDVMLISLPD